MSFKNLFLRKLEGWVNEKVEVRTWSSYVEKEDLGNEQGGTVL